MSPLDRRSPLPLWAQLLDDLRRRLATGEFDERFPTDRELMEQYRASRHTVRHAVGQLCAEGLIERERGRGSFLTHRPIEQPLGVLYSLFRSLEERGIEQRSVVLALDRQLGLDAPHPVFRVERLAQQGDQPLEWRSSSVRGDRYAFVSRWDERQGVDRSLREAGSFDPVP